MKITLAQLNPTVGDVSGNLQKVIDTLERVGGATDLIVFSELFLVGYPPRDLVEKPSLIDQVQQALARLAEVYRPLSRAPGAGGGAPAHGPGHRQGLSDAAVLIGQGKVLFQQNKSLLPAYDVFDETRHFEPAAEVRVVALQGRNPWGSPSAKTPGTSRSCGSAGSIPWTPSRSWRTRAPRCSSTSPPRPSRWAKQCVRHRLLQTHARRYRAALGLRQPGGGQRRAHLRRPQHGPGRGGGGHRRAAGISGGGGHGGPGSNPATPGLYVPAGAHRHGARGPGPGPAGLSAEVRLHQGGGGAVRRGGFGGHLLPWRPRPWGRKTSWGS